MLQCMQVVANIEIDVEQVINAVSQKYNTPIENVTMDDIYEYISDNITYLDGKTSGIRYVSDGPSIDGFESGTYRKIEEKLEEMQQ